MDINNINFVVSELSASQQNFYLLQNANKLSEVKPNINVQIFAENLSRFCIRPRVAIMNIAEAWGQTGAFVATNLSTAAKTLNYPLANHKLFYIWDLEWIRPYNRYYNLYSPIYLNRQLEIACRSKEHADIFENTFNRKVKYIIEDYNMNNFIEVFKNESNGSN